MRNTAFLRRSNSELPQRSQAPPLFPSSYEAEDNVTYRASFPHPQTWGINQSDISYVPRFSTFFGSLGTVVESWHDKDKNCAFLIETGEGSVGHV